MKIAINRSSGGFKLSPTAHDFYTNLGGEEYPPWMINDYRVDRFLIETIEKLGLNANTKYSKLKVVEIPDDVAWEIVDNGVGIEHIREVSREWC